MHNFTIKNRHSHYKYWASSYFSIAKMPFNQACKWAGGSADKRCQSTPAISHSHCDCVMKKLLSPGLAK